MLLRNIGAICFHLQSFQRQHILVHSSSNTPASVLCSHEKNICILQQHFQNISFTIKIIQREVYIAIDLTDAANVLYK